VIINYNLARLPGKGSAIFLHVWNDEKSPTQGCTAVSEANMIAILKWLDFAKKPVIIQGRYEDLVSITREQVSPLYLLPDGFVYVIDIIPDIFTDLSKPAILAKQAALALAEAQRKLAERDYGLKILNAYCPRKEAASKSSYSRGGSVDVTLIDLKTGKEPDMGEENKGILLNTMESCGFKAENNKWGHFTLVNESGDC
jgi:hypothetical protein